MKKILFTIAILVLTFPTTAFAASWTPATVSFVSATSDSVTVELTSTNNWWTCFEFRGDGDVSQSTGPNPYFPGYELYPYVCIKNETRQITWPVNDYLEVRVNLGAEQDEYFDWLRFDALPEPEPSLIPLVDMFVFYSPTGFYEFGGGMVNTCSIFFDPSMGIQPALLSVERWCHGVPDDMVVGCSSTIFDDGAAGIFACDGFLESVGERRASLRDDIQGAEVDLLPKILRYLNLLRDLGYLE